MRGLGDEEAEPATRRLSIAVLARGDLEPGEVDLPEAGANAILRIPPGPALPGDDAVVSGRAQVVRHAAAERFVATVKAD